MIRVSKHPTALWVLAFANAWDTFSYFGTQTILVLYVLHVFHLPRQVGYLFYGMYAAFVYSLPVLGGMVSDRWLSGRRMMALGCLLNILGNLIMMSLTLPLFCLGLALSLVGSGLYKSNSLHLVGTLYTDQHPQKESAFTWVYLAVNVGGALAPLAYGIVAYQFAWHDVFLISAVGITLSLVAFLFFWRSWESVQPRSHARFKNLYSGLSILLVISVVTLCFYHPHFFTPIILLIFVGSIGYLFLTAYRVKGPTKQPLLALFVLLCFALFYFSAGLQIGTTITLFIQHKITQGVIHLKLPASTFSMLYCVFVLVLAPFAAALWKKLAALNRSIRVTTKVMLGIGLAGVGIAVFALAAITNWVIAGILVGVLLLSAGELVLTPAIYTAISDYAPSPIRGTFMGGWFLFIALGGYLSSVLASTSHGFADHFPIHHSLFSSEFIFISGFTLLVAFILWALSARLNRMLLIATTPTRLK